MLYFTLLAIIYIWKVVTAKLFPHLALLKYDKWIPIEEAIDFERLFVQGTPEQGLGTCQKAF